MSASTQTPQERFAYIAVLNKPWNFVSNAGLEIDACVTMVLYRGFFQDVDLAKAILPLGTGQMLAWSESSMTIGYAWGDRVYHLVARLAHHMEIIVCHEQSYSCSCTA